MWRHKAKWLEEKEVRIEKDAAKGVKLNKSSAIKDLMEEFDDEESILGEGDSEVEDLSEADKLRRTALRRVS